MKILLVDDHPIFLEGLKNLLMARGLHVVDTARNGDEALEKVSRSLPDVVLMDILMKPKSGLETTRLIKTKFPAVKVIMLTICETEKDLLQAIKSGASGYLLKNLNADALYNTLKQYERGEIPLSPEFSPQLFPEFRRNDKAFKPTNWPINAASENKFNALSPRQKEVLVLVAQGMKYRDIGTNLGVSERTVKYYMEMILDKLHVENRSQAIKYVIQEGLVD